MKRESRKRENVKEIGRKIGKRIYIGQRSKIFLKREGILCYQFFQYHGI
jgi:hypothetical protein